MATLRQVNTPKNAAGNSQDISKSVVVDGNTYSLTDVKDGITAGFGNSNNLSVQETKLLDFGKLANSSDVFDIKKLIQTKINLNVAYRCITNSLAMNNAKKANKIQKVNLGDITYYIVPKVKPGSIKNVVSFNRFMAVCIAAIRVNLTNMTYDWEKYEYKKVNSTVTKDEVPDNVGNKLALACGMSATHDLYWFYATGFEFTFEMYPIEVICCVMLRIAHKDAFKLNKMDDMDLVKNLAAQIGKKGDVSDVIEKIGIENIKSKYAEYDSKRSELMSVKRNKDTLEVLHELLGKLK